MALHADEQIASAREGFLGGFAAAHDQENAVSLHGQNYGVGGGHDRRSVDDDKFELGAELDNGVRELVGGKQVRRIGRKRSRGNGGKIGNEWVLDGDEIEAGDSREIGAEARVFAVAKVEEAA